MTATQHDRKEIPEYRNTITAESVDDETIRVCFDGMDYLFDREAARILLMLLKDHVWPELTDVNALRFLANETLVRENERLVARNAILERVLRVADKVTDCTLGCEQHFDDLVSVVMIAKENAS